MALITKTVKPSGGDYTSLSAWDAAEATDLVTATNQHRCECYKGDYTGSGGGVNYISDSLLLSSSWVTNSTYNITIIVPLSERHSGRPKDGSGNYTGFTVRNDGGWVRGIYLNSIDYTNLDGFIVDVYDNTGGSGIFAYSNGGITDNCIVINASYSGIYAYHCGSTTHTVINSIAIDSSIAFRCPDWGQGKIYNCGAHNCVTGFHLSGIGPADKLKNCWAKGCTTGFSISGTHTIENCASSDASLPTGNGNRNSQTFTFVDEANDYFQPNVNDSAIKGYGQDLSAIFTDDILGNTRTTPWDIGPFVFAKGQPMALRNLSVPHIRTQNWAQPIGIN
ncbi:MAG: hypothetical protein U9Q21_02615 [Candidatus Auribacterota bacterium]|nr:hypothetical protein [Candidatus Auribacterota bacterium]